MMSVKISDAECNKYGIKREEADQIVEAIRGFAEEFYAQKVNRTLLKVKDDFPKTAMRYKRKN